jgi:hypothetical protein
MMLKQLGKKMDVPDFDQTKPLMRSIMHDWGIFSICIPRIRSYSGWKLNLKING